MGRLIYIVTCLILLCASSGFAQNSPVRNGRPAFPAEMILAYTNTTTLLCGETLYFKLHCMDVSSQSAGISKIAYVELIDVNRKSVVKHKLFIENGVAYGDLFMSVALSSGNYKLIAYTSWMLEQSVSNFITVDIIVINPFQPFSSIHDSIPAESQLRMTKAQSVSIQTDKKRYSLREKVAVKITSVDKISGNYSLSVRKSDLELETKSEKETQQKWPQTNRQNKLPEMRGELISGSVLSKTHAPASNIPVALSMPGNPYSFKISETDASGKFYFILDKNPNNTEIVLQVMGNNRADYTLQIDEAPKPDTSQLQFDKNIAIPKNLHNIIAEKSVASQIENSYYDQKKDSILFVAKPDPFFNSLAKTYVLDDYTRFPTLKETIIEVLKELYVKKSKNTYTLHLRNFNMDAEIYGTPLILVDGLLIQDFNELMDFGAKYIEQVSVVNEPYIYGSKAFSGVIAFTTKNQDFRSQVAGNFIKKITIDRPILTKIYKTPDYSAGNLLKRIPDYRTQLLWIPEINLKEQETVSFYTSDIPGTYEVRVEGISDDGNPISIIESIEIK